MGNAASPGGAHCPALDPMTVDGEGTATNRDYGPDDVDALCWQMDRSSIGSLRHRMEAQLTPASPKGGFEDAAMNRHFNEMTCRMLFLVEILKGITSYNYKMVQLVGDTATVCNYCQSLSLGQLEDLRYATLIAWNARKAVISDEAYDIIVSLIAEKITHDPVASAKSLAPSQVKTLSDFIIMRVDTKAPIISPSIQRTFSMAVTNTSAQPATQLCHNIASLRVTLGNPARLDSVKNSSTIFAMQVLSDLHLEFEGQSAFHFIPCAPYLALCGDIGNPFQPSYSNFLRQQSLQFKHVFVVAGNHEFYGNEYRQTREQMTRVCQLLPNVTFLDKTSFVVPGTKIRVIGGTLWSRKAALNVNDYNYITFGDRKLVPHDTMRIHLEEVEFIMSELATAASLGELVVGISHHVPCYNCTSFGTNLTSELCSPGSVLRCWCYGHDHQSSISEVNSTVFVGNELGYYWASGERDLKFSPETVVVVDQASPATWILQGPPLIKS
ncbi:Serine/threonine protein phosphatase [Pelomyxa schiedti]|nr:Serine/threonine protein phosphatase [Pelomyxa schiedti]